MVRQAVPVLFPLLVCLGVLWPPSVGLDCFGGPGAVVNITGELECKFCGGRLRLEGASGVIRDHVAGQTYAARSQCLYLLQPGNGSVNIRLSSFFTECQWDYLYVLEGDSLFSRQLAAFTGRIIPPSNGSSSDSTPLPDPTPLPIVNGTNDTNSSSSPQTVPSPYMEPVELVLTASSPLLLYFFSDNALNAPGFELIYWAEGECPGNCSGRGVCEANGSCSCGRGWRGRLCQLPACPNNCYGNGACDNATGLCLCEAGFTGDDCSVSLLDTHWALQAASLSPADTPLPALARAGHTAVVWGEYMVVYGGYQLASGQQPEGEFPQLLWYHFPSQTWQVSSLGLDGADFPDPRHSHSAVLYNDTMYVFGGSKLPQETITNELWAFNLTNQTWTRLFQDPEEETPALMNNSSTMNTTVDQNNSSTINATMEPSDNVTMMPANQVSYLPLPVRGHTAHIVGSSMLVLFGQSSREGGHVSFVQEYDLESGNWSTPTQAGLVPDPRLGHSSVFHADSRLVYVYGGASDETLIAELLTYDPVTHFWSRLSAAGSEGPILKRYHHSSVMVGPLLLVFAGCNSLGVDRDCFTKDLLVYNTVCNTWSEWDVGGLRGNDRRYGHSAVLHPNGTSMVVFGGFFGRMHHELLALNFGNCSVTPMCGVNGSQSICSWSSCVPGPWPDADQLDWSCPVDECLGIDSCEECVNSSSECLWSNVRFLCHQATDNQTQSLDICQPASECGRYSSCLSCSSHDCVWEEGLQTCLTQDLFNASIHTADNCSASTPVSCFDHTSCDACLPSPGCLWCPSLQQCLPNRAYPTSYPFGQCLGYVMSCPADCSTHQGCGVCDDDPECGWCNDQSDTGLGLCMEGGFIMARNQSLCPEERWFFDTCPLCNCNGHSVCVNESVCEACQNMTTGDHCQQCVDHFTGNPANGNSCSPCECNGYSDICDHRNGTCLCVDIGVGGKNCTQCRGDEFYIGDADNFCYYEMNVGFIYTFGVPSEGFTRGFYGARPHDDVKIKFTFEVTENPLGQPITFQIFLGRHSEQLQILYNLTEPQVIWTTGSWDREFDSFGSNRNASAAQLTTFLRGALLNDGNFTELFNSRSENDYTSGMWDGDVTLVVHVTGLTLPAVFKITLDDTDLFFLLYFFVTFIICFSVLLTVFLVGWYFKRKWDIRSMRRQQYVELRRRVSRPFARVKLVVDKPDFVVPQSPSYISVETVKSSKTAVLSLFVRLPGDGRGSAMPGRSGVCVGSTLVRVNPAKKKKPEKASSPPGGMASGGVASGGVARRRDRSRSNSTPLETLG